MSSGNYEPAYVEDLHGILMDKFHEFRLSITTETEVTLTGIDLNNIIAKAKTELYRLRPDSRKAGFKNLEL